MMNERGKSDSLVVPEKPSNKAGKLAAERVEGRGLAKGNLLEGSAYRTQCRVSASSALERVRQAAGRDRRQRFTTLFHHILEVERLRQAYRALKRNASAGVDGETGKDWGATFRISRSG